ncbi:anaerobic carbon-monoxide dehydrogenase catalytic subunit [uncultured Clostridium sp.]|uniref:anaerobic carbon-monoxide dehydrogenase catalytic subunit n=1 Tax=uncultured Clostridium sp. TaxID=59620 RepID=UPI00261A7054|nr:anaerobic carbon-monoxide dehydrogenase catalytic subunit [uncultured Clostridium sp.]
MSNCSKTSCQVGCNTCMSADKKLEGFIKELDVETSHHRVESQSIKCKFGLDGVCCRLCSNGPCRITPKAKRGICGADADTIVARNFLRAVAAGSGCYIHVIETTALNLKKMAENREELKGISALERLAETLEISGEDEFEVALRIADSVLKDLYKPRYDKMDLVEKLAYAPRYERWKELGILPGGAKSEVFDGVVKSSTNLSSDPIDMYMSSLRLGISTGLYGLTLVNLLNDIMLGDPVIRQASVGMKVIDEDYINIMTTGHQHSVIAHLQDALISEEATKLAESVGAKGFRIVGCTCVGQDLQVRGEHYNEVFVGHAGNNYTSEAVLATGGIDLVTSEFNCTLPGIEPIAEKFNIKMICLDNVAKKKNAESVVYSYEEREAITKKVMEEAVESYKVRRPNITLNIPKDHGHDDVLTGLSEYNLKEFLGGNWKALVDLIAEGKIKGIACIVGCSNLTAKGHDVFTVELAEELIKKDILILSAGCSSGGLENVGLMSPKAAAKAGDSLRAVCEALNIPPVLNFGPCLAIGRLEMIATELAEYLKIDIPQLPLVLSAPQWLEEQALADGVFGLTLGLPLHLALPPFVGGSEVALNLFSEGLKDITGGQLIINGDVEDTAKTLEEIILNRRENLGL